MSELQYIVPRVGGIWTAIEEHPDFGTRAKVAVVMVTSPFTSATFGYKESSVVLAGVDAQGCPASIAYPLSEFMVLYEPDPSLFPKEESDDFALAT